MQRPAFPVLLLLLVLLAGSSLALAQQQHIRNGPQPPAIPAAFSRKGIQYTAFDMPPYETPSGIPATLPYQATRIESYYDYSRRALREVYPDYCVPIFVNGSEWSCDFLNVDGTSYLLQHEDRPAGQPECCVFLKPFYPPPPDFLQRAGAHFLRNTTINGATSSWWQLDVPQDQGGPFGYGFYSNNVPSAFYFGGFWHYANGTNAMAMTTQYYSDFDPSPPPASTWDLPSACDNAQPCTNWPLGARPAHWFQ
eukprot:m.303303 g.303303  ORF g.303303 m.303303 type:complete len:252 (-) comp15823_c0_seq1:59-814(-)